MTATILLLAITLTYSIAQAASGQALPNFSPVAALVFCAAAYLHGRHSRYLPLLVWAISYPINAAIQGYSWHAGLLPTVIGALAIWFFGNAMRPQQNLTKWVAGTFGSSILFYLITNAFSLTDSRYASGFQGVYQCLWAGAPSDALPTWAFFKNSLFSNLLFTSLFVIAHKAQVKAYPELTQVAKS